MNLTLDAKAECARAIRAELRAGDPVEAYLIYNPEWAGGLGMIPENLRPGLIHHVLIGQPTGHFLMALLFNDLSKAVAHADPTSLASLCQLVQFLHNSTPQLCHGSRAKVLAWRAEGGALSFEYDDADLEGAG